MQCYTQLIAPTAVTHSLSLPFLSATANNLVVAKTSLLQIFALKSILVEAGDITTTSIKAGGSGQQRRERLQTTKLVLISQYEIPGTITALARVKTLRSKSGGEAILVALKDAKLSLIEWDPECYSISTVSIHYYERDELQCAPWDIDAGRLPTCLTVDPSSRCAALKFGARHIAILPFHQAGDDLVIDEDEHQVNGINSARHDSTANVTNGDSMSLPPPYANSFVLSLLALDPNLIHPINLAFLHGYREPTFGILSSQAAVSSALVHERRDSVFYTVYTLDLEQRASTALLSIIHLPYDLSTIVPLPLPVGGALLIGINELVHVDQSGKSNGIAVNEFAKQCTAFPLSSQSNLGFRLEGCVVEQLSNQAGDMLVLLKSGELAILSFKIDGRSVSGLSLRKVSQHGQPFMTISTASCTSTIGRGRIFVGSEDANSLVLGWTVRSSKPRRRRRSEAEDTEQPDDESDVGEEEDEDDDDDDDLYSTEPAANTSDHQNQASSIDESPEHYVFRIHDSLINLAPLQDVKIVGMDGNEGNPNTETLGTELLVTSGRAEGGRLAKLSYRLTPRNKQKHDMPLVKAVWSVSIKREANVTSNDIAAQEDHSMSLIVSTISKTGEEESHAYVQSNGTLQEVEDGDFESSAGPTVAVGTLAGGQRIVQVLKNEIRGYDSDFGLAQIFPMIDEPSPSDPNIICVSFAEPYILILREGSSMMLLKADGTGDLEEVDIPDSMTSTVWTSGSLFDDPDDFFCLETDGNDDEESENILLFLLSEHGALQIFRLPGLQKPLYVANGFSFLPPFLSSDFTVRRSTAKDVIVEILVAEIGDSTSKTPYLIALSDSGNITLYQPYQALLKDSSRGELRFLKVPAPNLAGHARPHEVRNGPSLRFLPDVDGYSIVIVLGAFSSLILKTAAEQPHIIAISASAIQSITGFRNGRSGSGFIWSNDEGAVYSARLPQGVAYIGGWVYETLFQGSEIKAFDYHQGMDRYIIGTSKMVSYKLAEDELHPDWNSEATEFLPQVEQSEVKLLDPSTWAVTDTFTLDQAEVVTCIKTMLLETSEHSQVRQSLAVVGTSVVRGDDLPMRGHVYVLDIIEVVPEPDRPETGRMFKLIAREDVRGAVTAIDEIGTEGFMIVAQGQKCMVRGLKEDNTLLPVAFIDTQCYATVVKELRSTGLCIIGDVIKGLWLIGYTEDPYQLKLFGKSARHINVVTADFLPDGKQLYITAVDADGHLHVLQFDPSNPKSLSGQRLLLLSSFNTGAYPSFMTLMPAPPNSLDEQVETDEPLTNSKILMASENGSLALLATISLPAYRALAALQGYLTNTLSHPLGLNPRSYRNAEADISIGGRAVLDGNVLKIWNELGSWKQSEGTFRTGLTDWELRELLWSACSL